MGRGSEGKLCMWPIVFSRIPYHLTGVESDMYECEMSRTIRLHRCQAKTTRFMVAATVESGAFDIRK